MRTVTYSLGVSADGYIAGPDGTFDWGAPDEELFAYATDEVRGLRAHLLGRHLYETMRYWETEDPSTFSDAELEFAELWNGLDKVVFSTTLSEVEGSNTRLASRSVVEEIEALRADDDGDGDLAIGGATLAHAVADAGLIDEYRIRIHPVLVGGGTPYFAHHARHDDLELVASRTFVSQVVALRYRVKR